MSTKKNSLISVIIPTYNNESILEKCLDSIQQQTYQRYEIIVVDNNSSDNTKKIAKQYTNFVYNKGPERSSQRNFGVSKSSGEYVLIIDSDMILGKNVLKSCMEQFTKKSNIVGIVIPEESFGTSFWAKCKKLERRFYLDVDWMEAARFFPRKIFNEFNGYDEKNTGTEDYDLPQRIKGKYGRLAFGRCSDYIYHNEGNLSLIKTLKKKYYYAQNLHQYKKVKENEEKMKIQSSIFARYRLFFSDPKLLMSNPVVGCGMLFMKTCEFAAGGLGYITHKK